MSLYARSEKNAKRICSIFLRLIPKQRLFSPSIVALEHDFSILKLIRFQPTFLRREGKTCELRN